jgi:putative endonuclease
MNDYCVYILKCSDGSYYTGITNDIERRFFEHSSGINKDSYTFSRRPLILVFTEYFQDVNHAIEFEKQVKGWSRKKKQAIIARNWEKLPELAKCMNDSTHLNYEKSNKELFDSAQSDKE